MQPNAECQAELTPRANHSVACGIVEGVVTRIDNECIHVGMRSEVENGAGNDIVGRIRIDRSDIAGKTGTTNDCVDAWFLGFSPDYTCGVWVGFDEESSLGKDETWGKATPIWGYFMRDVLKERPVKEFPPVKSTEREFRKRCPHSMTEFSRLTRLDCNTLIPFSKPCPI